MAATAPKTLEYEIEVEGIFTERDVLMHVAGHALDPERTAVSACMTPDPVTLPRFEPVARATRQVSQPRRRVTLFQLDLCYSWHTSG